MHGRATNRMGHGVQAAVCRAASDRSAATAVDDQKATNKITQASFVSAVCVDEPWKKPMNKVE